MDIGASAGGGVARSVDHRGTAAGGGVRGLGGMEGRLRAPLPAVVGDCKYARADALNDMSDSDPDSEGEVGVRGILQAMGVSLGFDLIERKESSHPDRWTGRGGVGGMRANPL